MQNSKLVNRFLKCPVCAIRLTNLEPEIDINIASVATRMLESVIALFAKPAKIAEIFSTGIRPKLQYVIAATVTPIPIDEMYLKYLIKVANPQTELA